MDALSLLVGNHCKFAREGQQIPGQASGVVVDKTHKPDYNALEGGLYTTICDAISTDCNKNVTTADHRRAAPCILQKVDSIVTAIDRDYTINGEGVTKFGMEIIFGCKFNGDNIAEIDGTPQIRGWWLWRVVDDQKNYLWTVNAWGQIDISSAPKFTPEDISKPVFKIVQLYVPGRNKMQIGSQFNQ